MDKYDRVRLLCRYNDRLINEVCHKLKIAASQTSRFSPKFQEIIDNEEKGTNTSPLLLLLYQSATNYYDWEFLVTFCYLSPSSIQDKVPEIFNKAVECADSFLKLERINYYATNHRSENVQKQILLTTIKNKMIAIGTLENWLNIYFDELNDKEMINLALEQITRLIAEEIKKSAKSVQ
ncbi:MAG TPA: hypothetical protein PLI45_04745 [Candidatus Woesebacteria bacterium]|nr:hypothetical protein [Candidatus Woesebacteria bacterium]